MSCQPVLWRIGGAARYLWHRVRSHRAYRVQNWAYDCTTCGKDWR